MTYLGIMLSDDWSIKKHLENTLVKAEGIMNRLGRLMATKKGPREKKRRLYQNVINSVLLYGAPIWAEEINERVKMASRARAVQRKVVIRVISGYRTISQEVTLMVARNPPLELLAGKLKEVYMRKMRLEEENITITDRGMNLIRKQEHDRMIKKWWTKMKRRANAGIGVNWEILSCFNEWVSRNHGEMTFHATQLITGHGCVKGYTHRIGKTANSKCSFCGHEVEDSYHVLTECREWEDRREDLERAFGGRVNTLGMLLRGAATDPRKWCAMLEFAGKVIDRKEEVEREEQAEERRNRIIRETEEILGASGCVGARRRTDENSTHDR